MIRHLCLGCHLVALSSKLVIAMYLIDFEHYQEVDEKVLYEDNDIQWIHSQMPEDGIVSREHPNHGECHKEGARWDGVLVMMGRVISLSTLIDSLLNATSGMKMGLSWFSSKSIRTKAS